nr:MFS transporter [Brevibacterium daeguense]
MRNYQEIFALPGALRFSLAGLIARFPIAVLGLGIVLFIQGVSGSYGIAGIVTATFMVAQAVTNPFIARLVDRFGQARVMIPVVIVHLLALTGLLVTVYADWWFGLVFAFAALAGATVGSLGSLVRARWNAVTTTTRQLDTAFSWEAVADEILFVSGPVLVTALATAVFPPAGILFSMATTTIGSVLFYSQRSTEPVPHRSTGSDRGKVLTNLGIFIVVVAQVLLGINFGALDVIAVAFAEEQGRKALAGLLLSAFAAGSLLAGAIYGARTWKSRVHHRFTVLLVLLAASTWLLFLGRDMVSFAIVMFLVGLTIAPTLIAASSVIKELAPPQRLTEALAWISTSLGFGVAIGSALSGIVIDAAGARAAVIVMVAASTASALVAVIFIRAMDPQVSSHTARAGRTVIDTSDQ